MGLTSRRILDYASRLLFFHTMLVLDSAIPYIRFLMPVTCCRYFLLSKIKDHRKIKCLGKMVIFQERMDMKRTTEEKNKKEEKVSVGHKVLTLIGAVLCVILLPILILNCTLIIKSYINKEQVPNVGGLFPMIILTDSMEPVFSSGDLIICHTMDAEAVKEGDIICFYDPAGNGTTTVTHRVTEVTTDENGTLAWKTKGDANNAEDDALVPSEKLAGVYKTHIAGLGNIAMFMQTTQGLILCVICPIVLLVAYDVIRRRSYEKSKKKDKEALMAELEALRAEKKEQEERNK